MKKETIFKFLTWSCFLLPGNVKSKKGWFLSPLSLLSFLTIILVVLSTLGEFIGYKIFIRNEKIKEAMSKLKHVPARPIGFCLRSLEGNETLVEVESEIGVSVEIVKVGNTNSTHHDHQHLSKSYNTTSSSAARHPMSDLEDIVSSGSRLLIFVTNILIRIFLWFSFPTLVDLFTSVFQSQQQQKQKKSGGSDDDDDDDSTYAKNGFMCLLWYEASQKWSTGEKVFLLIIALSQFQRQLEFFAKYYTSITSAGLDMLVVHCLVFQVFLEQGKVLLSRELVSEIVAFFLVVVMKTFVNVIQVIAGANGNVISYDNNDEMKVNQNNGFLIGEIVGSKQDGSSRDGKLDKQANTSNILFIKTRAMLMKGEDMSNKVRAPNGRIATIDEHISGIIGGSNGNPVGIIESQVSSSEMVFQKRKRFDEFYVGSSAATAEAIYDQINFVISKYFELMGIWEQAQKITGFVTLILFCELTTTFCFNTYITLDNAMNFGLFSEFGVSGIIKGVVVITKLICICNAAQDLREMTPILLDHLLKLKLRLLSLPIEHYKKSEGKNSFDSSSSRALSQCERCRGLGSFLSEMISYIRAHPFELSALGYFTVSRSTLTTITGVIVTYLVVLVQFQSYASSK